MSMPKTGKTAICTLLAITVIAGLFYLNRPESASNLQSTDNAYVRADFTQVSPQVSGRIAQVLVEENQRVTPGQVLAVIDDQDFSIALAHARARVLSAEAVIESLSAQLGRQESEIVRARATVTADQAALRLAEADLARYRNLAADGSGTVQALQQAQAQATIHNANLEKDRAAHQAAQRQLDILHAELRKAQAALAQMKAEEASAELNLSYTRITAPIAGTVGQRSLRVGAFIATGRPVAAIVPLDDVYIEANYRETQLARVRPGQPVKIRVDALPGVTLSGTVDSLAPASNASYAPLGPQNATGNFTKIVQRLTARIRLDTDQPDAARLRVGMSVEPEIDVSVDIAGVQSNGKVAMKGD
ncbi:HlyD family secretion protein [Achromobacter insolitus]|uniref:HlyD family secretion protein n=2 Tax=Achromobacter insolitus TaxID=217204 RepID=UPI000DD185E9|nr:HlyD family secretion protein [Achromobacter insolitus]AXA69870.1 efflux transporter periplasmic adaptor subunit [Achromobacter insolitus]NGT15174.1 HlyD family secretion protein [Achromobacter insolitus]